MFDVLARIEAMLKEHAPDVLDELVRAVDALDAIARSTKEIAHYIGSAEITVREREVIEGHSERVK